MIELSIYYLKREKNPDSAKAIEPVTKGNGKTTKYEEFTSGNLEDAITKVMKLIANLSTEEEGAQRDLILLA